MYLPHQYHLDQILPLLTQQDIKQACKNHIKLINEQFSNLQELTKQQEQYQNKLLLLELKKSVNSLLLTYKLTGINLYIVLLNHVLFGVVYDY
jgi:hypothetical protein